MRTKNARIFALLLSMLLAFGILPLSAFAEEDLIANPGFEALEEDGSPAGWYIEGSGAKITTEAHAGKNAMELAPKTSVALCYDVQNIEGGTPYKLSAMMFTEKSDSKPVIKILWKQEKDGGVEQKLSEAKYPQTLKSAGIWVKVEETLTAPDAATAATVCIAQSGGKTCWDDISFIGEKAAERVKGEIKELLTNGNFETTANDLPTGWGLSGGEKGTTFALTDEAYEGKTAVRFFNDPSAISLATTANDMVGGAEYEFSGMIKLIRSNGGYMAVKITYQKPDGKGSYITIKQESIGFPVNEGEWEKVSHTFTAPAGTTRASVMIRLVGGGECLWDMVSFKGEAKASVTEKTEVTLQSTGSLPPVVQAALDAGKVEEEKDIGKKDEVWPPFKDSKNLFVNSDFEELNTDGKTVKAFGTTRKDCTSVINTNVHSGKSAIGLKTDDKTANPYLSQLLDDIVGGALYQVSFWYRMPDVNMTGYPTIKLEFWTDRSIPGALSVGQTYVRGDLEKSTEWKQYIFNVRAPYTAQEVTALVRLMGVGEVYIDDVSMVMVEGLPVCQLETDNIFYYSDLKEGTASVSVDTAFYPEYADAFASFTLSDNDKVLAESGEMQLSNGKAEWKFGLSLLSVMKKEYKVTLSMRDAAGNDLGTDTQLISKYPRPSGVTKDGRIVTETGEEFPLVFAYRPRQPEKLKSEAGFTVMQGSINNSVEQIKTVLDNGLAAGVKYLIPLYDGMKPAGSPENAIKTYEVVSTLKDHPALFGWMTQDEPFHQLATPQSGLYHSYRIIREIDEVHPLVHTEASAMHYTESAKYCDIFGIDPYSAGITGHVANQTELAVQATNYQKPVMTIMVGATLTNLTPTGDDLRNNLYQAYFAGATGTGIYNIGNADKDANGKYINLFDIPDDRWSSLMAFHEKERALFEEHFVQGRTPSFNKKTEETYRYASFVKDGAVYLAIASRSSNTETVNIPLESYDGMVKIGAFTAEGIAGGATPSIKGNGSFTASLPSGKAHLYKITPSVPVDFSGLGCTRFQDIDAYPWARTQIAYLDEKEVINRVSPWAFEPERKITRGEFAYALIRALGLSNGETGDNFADVAADAFYAKEVAIGKKLGILKGVDDKAFQPETEISRQDIMVIAARGMKIVKQLADGDENTLSVFSDKTAIADYAILSIAAMVRENIVRGNVDGTLNPIGNTTRAEAACILYRIMHWNGEK